jgi:CubicO group peptidase (beta-lactamase class C family)
MTLEAHTLRRNQAVADGYRFISLSVYGGEDQLYAAVLTKPRPGGFPAADQHDIPSIRYSDLPATLATQKGLGFGAVILAANSTPGQVTFAAVFEPGLTTCQFDLEDGPATAASISPGERVQWVPNKATLQGRNYAARSPAQMLRWAAAYTTLLGPRYAGIWIPNRDATLWNNDGLSDDVAALTTRDNLERGVWCRPSFVTVNDDHRYLSVFVANEIGDSALRVNMTAAEYQVEFDRQRTLGNMPICVQAAGATAADARFAAIFARDTEVVPRRAKATGPCINDRIDTIAFNTMRQYPQIRQGALAIVHGAKLVYARGYTMAEPGWPVVNPTTYFRLASVSKTVTAFAVFQLIDEGKLALTDKMQDILKLTTPANDPPADPRFSQITIQQLLEHTSGLRTDAYADGAAIVGAYVAAGHAAALPVTQAMTDVYIASQQLEDDPGTVQRYNNCGYYMLGRCVARLRGEVDPVAAYLSYVLAPLGVTRVRAATDLIGAQPDDEARYQAACADYDAQSQSPNWPADLQLGTSQMTPEQPLVATGYGDDALERSQGAGGLSAAASDLARLCAVLIDPGVNATFSSATLRGMLQRASARFLAEQAANNTDPRAGYGFDYVSLQTPAGFHGNKGGLIQNAASVLSVNGDWGFVALWDSTATRRGAEWYPDWPGLMSVASGNSQWPKAAGGPKSPTAAYFGNVDLFPCFEMRSLAKATAGCVVQSGVTEPELSVFVIDSYGSLARFTIDGAGRVSGPTKVRALWFAPLGAQLSAAPSATSGSVDVFVVDATGTLTCSTVSNGVVPGGPQTVTEPGIAPAGGGITTTVRLGVPGRTDTYLVQGDGSIFGYWRNPAGRWTGPENVSGLGTAPPGAPVTASQRFGTTDQTDVFVIDTTGALNVFSSAQLGPWSRTTITPQGFAPPGAAIAAAREFGTTDRTNVFVVDTTGRLNVASAQGSGAFTTPERISDPMFPPGAPIAVSPHSGSPSQSDVFLVAEDGSYWVFYITAGRWGSRQLVIKPGFAPPGTTIVATPEDAASSGLVLARPGSPPVMQDSYTFIVDTAGDLTYVKSLGANGWSDATATVGTTG